LHACVPVSRIGAIYSEITQRYKLLRRENGETLSHGAFDDSSGVAGHASLVIRLTPSEYFSLASSSRAMISFFRRFIASRSALRLSNSHSASSCMASPVAFSRRLASSCKSLNLSLCYSIALVKVALSAFSRSRDWVSNQVESAPSSN